MTFVEAAIEILRQVKKPLSVKEITERAIKQNLLSVVGRAPESVMQQRLTQEAKKGDRTLLLRAASGAFGLSRYDRPAGEDAAASGAARSAEPDGGEAGAGRGRRRRRRGGRARKTEERAAAAQPEAGTPEEALAAAELAGEVDEAAAPAPAESIDLDAFQPRDRPRFGEVEIPSEDAVAEAYADELGEPAPVAAEPVVDERSADEDRALLPEIRDQRGERDRKHRRGRGKKPERERERERERGRGERERGERERGERERGERERGERERGERERGERERGRERRERERGERERERERERAAAAPAPAPSAPPTPPPTPSAPPAPVAPAISDVAAPPLDLPTTLADIAFSLLRSLGDPRPIHARQLAAMALKRKLVTGDPEELFRAFRAALLDDARARQGRGLRPRLRHHGGSLFALATSRVEPELARVEDLLAQSAAALADHSRAALRRRLLELPPPAFEQLVRVWLERTGWREIAEVKRVEQTAYLAARTRDGALAARVLVAVRAGTEEIGRRAVGELRAGVVAKQLEQGLLVAAARIGTEGEREARAPGPGTRILDGDAFAEELMRAGVGVLRVGMPIAYLDADFFAELTQS